MTGHALHIGLNHVDPNAYGGWDGALSGCINDANSMLGLTSNAGFSTTQLLDSQANSQTVIGELGRLARTAVAGDLCVVTYSGHGGQVDDSNGDEDDWQDETWVLWDRQVIDDELFQMWSQFAAGVRILVFSDSCHSGTVARDAVCLDARQSLASRPRSMSDAEPAVQLASVPKNMPHDVQTRDNDERRGTYQFVQALSGPRSAANIAAELILISGCQDNQLSYDGAVNGQFTGTLLQVWGNGSFQGDHTQFHRQILDRMPPDQSPNLFTVGTVSPGFLGQRPFTIQAPAGPGSGPVAPQGGGGRPTLRVGSSGTDVVYLQQRLNAHGHSLIADGIFGFGTQQAVQRFQAAHGLTPDGVVGPMTWNTLETVPIGGTPAPVGGTGTAGGTSGGTGSGPTGGQTGGSGTGGSGTGGSSTGGVSTMARPTIRRGDTGEHVTHLQQRLGAHGYHLTADGIFGPGTESAVRSFQRSNSLVADGIVGQNTWAALG